MSAESDKLISTAFAVKENVTSKMDETRTQTYIGSTSNILQTPVAHNRTRDRRNQSPSINGLLFDSILEPPVSPSSTSSIDATFEPTIDMMVNDFDDEQTLNEEEALADQEAQNPDDEIATLREESEMPIEELLAKYGGEPSLEAPQNKKSKKRKKKRIEKSTQMNECGNERNDGCKSIENIEHCASNKIDKFVSECGDANYTCQSVKSDNCSDEDIAEELVAQSKISNEFATQDLRKPHRSHLLDLYPKGTFDSLIPFENKDAQHDEMIEDEYEDNEEDADDGATDSDCFKKTVMVGPDYQAAIPEGLSQYGDVLPYENEDKLIWEPSQVSEREVEEYLLRARDIKPSMLEELPSVEKETDNNLQDKKQSDTRDKKDEKLKEDKLFNGAEINGEQNIVVKDNEQALHLLVQCGYDFKEALRRKRLNVLPLTGTMSLWSDEECQKFEEGIQKFGKDFLKIRQQLVRTRTMREMVQFYYLWKKSDRRDQNFANADTVDHMDIYLNESTEYASNNALSVATGTTLTTSVNSNRKAAIGNNKNVSIMTKNAAAAVPGTVTGTSASISINNQINAKLVNNRRRISLQENGNKNELLIDPTTTYTEK